MALTDEGNGNGFYMPVAPAYGGGYNNGGFGMKAIGLGSSCFCWPSAAAGAWAVSAAALCGL